MANEDYYGTAPSIKKLTLVFMDMDTAYAALCNGDVDVIQINGTLADQKPEAHTTHTQHERYGVLHGAE